MSAIKRAMAVLEELVENKNNGMPIKMVYELYQEISDRLDAHDKVLQAHKEFAMLQSQRIDRLEQQAHKPKLSDIPQSIIDRLKPVSDERSCSNCKFEKYADEEEPCVSCLNPDNYDADNWQPREEKDDYPKEYWKETCKKWHDSYMENNAELRDLRARLADEKKSSLEFAKGLEEMAQALNFVKGICDRGNYEGTEQEKLYVPLRILGYVKQLEARLAVANADLAMKEHAKDALRVERDEAIRQLEESIMERAALADLKVERDELKKENAELKRNLKATRDAVDMMKRTLEGGK